MSSFASGTASPSGNQPHVDTRLEEHDDGEGGTLYILIDIPQYSAEDLTVRHAGDKIQVTAPPTRTRKRLDKTIQLPISADVEGITGSFNNGVLTIPIPLDSLDDEVSF